jgi:hypothetical protein
MGALFLVISAVIFWGGFAEERRCSEPPAQHA